MFRLPLLILMLCTLSACASHYGTPAIQDYGRYLTLQPGISTKHDIYHRFGQPHDLRITDTGTEWLYFKMDMRMNGWTLVPFVGVLAAGGTVESMHARIAFDSMERYMGVETSTARKYANSWVMLGHSLHMSKAPEQRVQEEMTHLQLPFDPAIAQDVKLLRKAAGL